jgi:hypothetical protein
VIYEAKARLALEASRLGINLGYGETGEARVVLRLRNARIPYASLGATGARDDGDDNANRDHDQDGASHFRRFSLFVERIALGIAVAHAHRGAEARK